MKSATPAIAGIILFVVFWWAIARNPAHRSPAVPHSAETPQPQSSPTTEILPALMLRAAETRIPAPSNASGMPSVSAPSPPPAAAPHPSLQFPQHLVQKIATSEIGDSISLPFINAEGKNGSARVFMAEATDDGAWFRALQLDRFHGIDDAVLTLAKEPGGELLAMIVSSSSLSAWRFIGTETTPLLLESVPKAALFPECAG